MRKGYAIMIAVLTLVASVAGCGRTGRPALRTGDLVFVNIPADYDLELGSTSGTADKIMIHVAILDVSGDSVSIIDATIKRGVARYPLDTFLHDFTLRDGSLPTFEIKRPSVSAREASEFVDNAKEYLGLPYDVSFLPDNGAMYCSELVYNSYVTSDGKHLFSETPISFLDAGGRLPVYWKQLFGLLGKEVPQGVIGTIPQTMSEDSVLKHVRSGF